MNRRPSPLQSNTCGIVPNGVDLDGQGGTARRLPLEVAMSTFVIALSDPRASLEWVGGKGMSLAKLSRAGLPVPGGFHITTAAYRYFVDVNDLQPGILSALQGAGEARPEAFDAASSAIEALFARA